MARTRRGPTSGCRKANGPSLWRCRRQLRFRRHQRALPRHTRGVRCARCRTGRAPGWAPRLTGRLPICRREAEGRRTRRAAPFRPSWRRTRPLHRHGDRHGTAPARRLVAGRPGRRQRRQHRAVRVAPTLGRLRHLVRHAAARLTHRAEAGRRLRHHHRAGHVVAAARRALHLRAALLGLPQRRGAHRVRPRGTTRPAAPVEGGDDALAVGSAFRRRRDPGPSVPPRGHRQRHHHRWKRALHGAQHDTSAHGLVPRAWKPNEA